LLEIASHSDKASLQNDGTVTGNASAPQITRPDKQGREVHAPRASKPSQPLASSFDTSSSHGSTYPQVPITATSEYVKAPLHPSLPPKPVAAVESLLAQTRPRIGATPVRVPVPIIPSIAANSTVTIVDPVVTLVTEQVSASVPLEETQSIPAQNSAALQQDYLGERKPLLGLAASIHAPGNVPQSSSAPSYLSSNPNPPAPHIFHPTHHRSRTVGRSPHTSNTTSFPSAVSRSGNSTPRGRFSPSGNHHTRTHSTPNSSVLNGRSPQTSRPVITGDAISKLAKTICSTSPTKAAAFTTFKE